jgi:hypothetical protein
LNNGIKCERNIKQFSYEWNGVRKYNPDFYLPEYDMFVEIKGYETSRDLAKWSSVTNLIVIKGNEIEEIKKHNRCKLLDQMIVSKTCSYQLS